MSNFTPIANHLPCVECHEVFKKGDEITTIDCRPRGKTKYALLIHPQCVQPTDVVFEVGTFTLDAHVTDTVQ
jgi:hypothetical protein